MSIFKRKKYNPRKIYLLTTEIISSRYNEDEPGPRCITQCYLATKKNKKFYELFSKVEIKYEDNSTPGFSVGEFDTPMIKKVEKIEGYVKNPKNKLSAEQLFYFITTKNIDEIISEDSEDLEDEVISEELEEE